MSGASSEDSWATLYRVPQMHAKSGAWLEAFSKRDAQAILIALPWTVMLITLTFFMVVYALEAFMPYFMGAFEQVVSFVHYLIATGCALYVPVALVIERPSFCCRRGPKRSKEGWIAIAAVAACALIALGYARSMHSLPDSRARISIIYGSVAFRAAATGEFLLQIAWLWAAAVLRCEPGQGVSRWRRWSYLLLIGLWCFTWWDAEGAPEASDHLVMVLGYSARLILFGYCVTRVFRKCSRHCQCCCFCASCRDEWMCLQNLPCTPGQERLRYLVFYLLTRPPFLLIMNLPLGYPLAGLATWALTLRCGLILLIAMSLRPAPAPAEEHPLETATREQFDVLLALHLCDFSWEAYYGAPEPAVLVLSGCSHEELNGEFFQVGRDKNSQPIWRRELPMHGEEALLRMSDSWEVVKRNSEGEERRFLYADHAEKLTDVDIWTEHHEEEEIPKATVKIRPGMNEARRHHSVSGGCPQLDVQWLLAEEMGALRSQAKDKAAGETGREVSIVVAFRGTASVKNLVTDVRISLQPLAEESKTGPFGICQGPVACFDLEPKVLSKLAGPPQNPFAPCSASEPLRSTSLRESAGEQENAGLPGCCRLIAACCSRLLFPFLPSDDDEEEELSAEAISEVRVHKGFAEAYGAIRPDVLAVLQARLEHWKKEGVRAKVYATGHSMGGAVASLFALDLSAAPLDDERSFPFDGPVVAYTYGAPRVGNAAFRSVYNALVPQTFRVVGSRDVVPTLPPSIVYRQIGREVWVDDAGELTFVMSWAMRHILPARDSVWYHPMLAYYKLLNRALLRKTGRSFHSRFRGDTSISEALNGKPLST